MKIQLNIRLDMKGGGGSLSGNNERCSLVIDRLKFLIGNGVYIRRYSKEVENNNGVIELWDCLFVEFEWVGSLQLLDMVCFRLAVSADQECIAAFIPRSGIGKLVGPYADAWGKFDLDSFDIFEREAA